MKIDKNKIEKVKQLRHELHEHPEISEHEIWTKNKLINFVKENSTCKIVDKGSFFYALHEEGENLETIGFRADFDAIKREDGSAFHGCGHDGHSAILCGLLISLEKVKIGKNIVFLFQHAEENGKGAKYVSEFLDEMKIKRIYGLHNWPGMEFGKPHTCYGTAMCASMGLTITYTGKQSHASEPEKGINPSFAIGKLIADLEEISKFKGYEKHTWQNIEFSSMAIATIVNVEIGNKGAFGVSPSKGEISLTIRGAKLEDLEKLKEKILGLAEKYGDMYKLKFEYKFSDLFPDTTNSREEVERIKKIFEKNKIKLNILKEPIRSSEDFGWYEKKIPGCFFFLGNGENHPLHSEKYEFLDENIEKGIELFSMIACD